MARKRTPAPSNRNRRRRALLFPLLLLAAPLFTQFDDTLKEDSFLAQEVRPRIQEVLLDLGVAPAILFPAAETYAPPAEPVQGETARVLRAIDGDTIEVMLRGEVLSVRYIGINTPERDEPCYEEAWRANIALVGGKTVTLVKDVSEVDRYGRLLRYVRVGDILVNRELVARGYAEAVLYETDDSHYAEFQRLERAAAEGRTCHVTGIFQDGNSER